MSTTSQVRMNVGGNMHWKFGSANTRFFMQLQLKDSLITITNLEDLDERILTSN
jgi:hypothetical protein